VVRLILGVPLGSDISSGYTYIMESMPRGEREAWAIGGSLCSPSARCSR
jgi:hypothetical protein